MPPANYLRQQWRHNSSQLHDATIAAPSCECAWMGPKSFLNLRMHWNITISSCTRAKPQLLDRGYIKSYPMGFFFSKMWRILLPRVFKTNDL